MEGFSPRDPLLFAYAKDFQFISIYYMHYNKSINITEPLNCLRIKYLGAQH